MGTGDREGGRGAARVVARAAVQVVRTREVDREASVARKGEEETTGQMPSEITERKVSLPLFLLLTLRVHGRARFFLLPFCCFSPLWAF